MRECREMEPNQSSFFRPKKATVKVRINIPAESMQRIEEGGE